MNESGKERIVKYYEENEDFRDYVDKYSINNKITVEEALTHKIVKEVYSLYWADELWWRRYSTLKVVVGKSVYETNRKGADGILKTARDKVPFGIYAIEKDSVVELRNDKFHDLDELKIQVSEFQDKGFKVYFNS